MGRDMASPTVRVEAAEKEAAEWHARLGTTSVASQTIYDFFEWRSKPGNADAYARVERVWKESRQLAGHPGIARAAAEARSRGDGRVRRRARDRWVQGGLIFAAVAGLAFGAGLWWTGRGVYETAVGEQRLVQLSDGSAVTLDTDSRLRVRYAGDERRIYLDRGQALFEVERDPRRPFRVSAGETQVTAIGTTFDVRRIGDAVRVTLVSGVVEVAGEGRASPPLRMRQGQQTRVSDRGTQTRAVDTAPETSWADGRLIFHDMPLETAVYEMNRYLTDKIEIDDPGIRAVAVNGVFRIGDREAFVAASSDVMGLAASTKPDGAIGLSRRPQ